MLRAVWAVDPMPVEYLDWQRANLRQATAFHEAGHAVLMLACGLTCIHATVSVDGKTGQARNTEPPQESGPTMPLEKQRAGAVWVASTFHAGVEAELLLGGFLAPGGTEWRFSGSSDFKGADSVLGDLFWRGRPHGYAKALSRAVLIRNWESLARIAQCLLDRGDWHPTDTPDLSILLGEDSESVWEACLAYGDSVPPSFNQQLTPGKGETRPHSPHLAGAIPGHVHAGARLDCSALNPGGASGVVTAPFKYQTISRRRPVLIACAAVGGAVRLINGE